MTTPTPPTLDAALRARLSARYAEPGRRYHTLAHIEALLRGLARWRRLAREPEMIEAAIWFHDAIYDPQRHDNEARSAELARVELLTLGWAESAIERVVALVRATAHHDADATDRDAWLFLDLDLSVLALDASHYAAYAAAIRAEYAHVDDARYGTGRAAVLRSFLDRDAIYRTPALHAAWEAAARANLGNELKTLG